MKIVPSSPQERWRLIEELFQKALDYEGVRRSSFLETACGSDLELRAEVESLLLSASQAGDFLECRVRDAALDYLEEGVREIAAGVCLGHYRILSMLGAGGMGRVYLAEDLRLRRKVALKALPRQLTSDQAALRRFHKEAQTVSALNHPNLLTVYDFCQIEEQHFLVTEYVEGDTLRELIRSQRLNEESAVAITVQIASGLAAAHSCGVIHRDIKPENVMVRGDGVAKLLDFGIAKLVQAPGLDRTTMDHTTMPGALFGTPKYMSPEQVRGVAVDARSDIFSLGTVLYEMVSGRAPFQGETTSDVLADVLRTNPAELTRAAPHCEKELARIAGKMLAKNPADRHASAAEVKAELQAFQLKQQNREYRRTTGRSKLLVWMGVLLLTAVLLWGAALLMRERSAKTGAGWKHSTLAVLPFTNVDGDEGTAYLSLSLADAISSKLEFVSALTVRPSSAVSGFRNLKSDADVLAAAHKLKTDLILTGRYARNGSKLDVSVRLLRVQPEKELWTDALTVDLNHLPAIQDRITEALVRDLGLPLTAAERTRLRPETPISSRAYEYYLRGVDLYFIGNYSLAITMLERSAAEEPNYAATWAHLGRAYTTNASLQFGGRVGYKKAEAAYEKAIELSPELPEPRIYMANLLTDTGRVEAAIPLLRVALESSPNSAEAHWELGYAYRFGGMLWQSLAEGVRARQLDPEVKISSSALNSYLYLGQYKRFLDSLPANDAPYLIFYRGFAQYYLGQWEEAQRAFNRAYDMDPELLPAQVGKAFSDKLSHRNADGIRLLQELEKRMEERGVSDAEAMYKVAQAYTALGDNASALRLLRRSVEGGFFCYDYFAKDPLLTPLRQEPRFAEILLQAKQRQQQFQQRFGRPMPYAQADQPR